MNAPKLVSIVVVLALAVYILYPTLDSAIPKQMTGAPFSFELDSSEEFGVAIDNETMSFNVNMPSIIFGSNLPEDFKDVKIEIFVGDTTSRVSAGTFDFGTIPAGQKVKQAFDSENLPLMYFMSYLGVMNEEGVVNIPIVLKVAFKYMEWQGEQLLDLSITVRSQGTADVHGNLTKEESGNTSTISVDASNGVVAQAVTKIKEAGYDSASITAGGATFSVAIDDDNKLTVTAAGTDMNAYRELLKMADDNDGTLTFTYNDKNFSISGEQATAVLNAVKTFYSEELQEAS